MAASALNALAALRRLAAALRISEAVVVMLPILAAATLASNLAAALSNAGFAVAISRQPAVFLGVEVLSELMDAPSIAMPRHTPTAKINFVERSIFLFVGIIGSGGGEAGNAAPGNSLSGFHSRAPSLR